MESDKVTERLLQSAARRSAAYLAGLDQRSVAPSSEAVAALSRFHTPMPDVGAEPERVLALLDEVGSPATMAMAGPRFFGFVIGGSLPTALAAHWLATAWDQNTGLFRVTPGTATLETVALGWLLELLRLPSDCGGAFVTGATVANFVGLAAARHAVLRQVGWDVEADGLFGAPPITVVVGEEAHPTLLKSLGLLGLGRDRVLRVPVDDQGRMRADRLPKLSGPAILCAQAGNVNTGSCDPFTAMCAHARQSGAWVHVDGAFGLWAATSSSRAHLLDGIEGADSWSTDAHKWLNVPYDCGLAFVRDREALRRAMAITAAYLPTEGPDRNPSDFVPELSRRARGVDVWAALMALGKTGVAELVDRTCRHARRFAEGLSAAGYEILNEVALNQVLVAFGDPETTERVIAAVQDDGTCWCGGTLWQGRTAMRISISGWNTTDEDVEKCLEAMRRVADASTRVPT